MIGWKGLPKLLISWPPWGGLKSCKIMMICINIPHIDWYCIKGISWSLSRPLLVLINSMMGLLICKYEPYWQKVSVDFLRLKWPLRPVCLLLEKFSWYKAGKVYEDNWYLYAIMFKGWWSAVMKDAAYGTHQGRRMQMERTPPMDDTADGSTTRIRWRIKLRILVSCVLACFYITGLGCCFPLPLCRFSFNMWWGCWFANMNPFDKKSVLSLWYSRDL